MGHVKKYENGKLVLQCSQCDGDFDCEVPADYTPKYLPEFEQYECLAFECPCCKKNGKNVTVVLNLNLPESEYDEEDLEYQMPFKEINSRKLIRDLMWDVRPDLKGKDRAEFNRKRGRIRKEQVEEAKRQFGSFKIKGAKNPRRQVLADERREEVRRALDERRNKDKD